MGTWDTLPTPSGIPTPSPTSTDTQWQTPKHIRLASVRYASYWNTFCYEVGEGYVFTGVCLSTGGHACLAHPPPCHACPPAMHTHCHARPTPPCHVRSPCTTTCGQRAGGTNPTGMHSCYILCSKFLRYCKETNLYHSKFGTKF